MPKRIKRPRMDSLATMRKRRGMTQRELSAALGLAPATVAQWERGYSVPNTDNLQAIADLFGCSMDAVLGREPPGKAGSLPPQ